MSWRTNGAALLVLCAAAAAIAAAAPESGQAGRPLQTGASATLPGTAGLDGRWELQYEVQPGRGQRGGRAGAATPARGGRGAGRGGGRAAGPSGPARTRVVLDLKPGPANTLTGTARAMGAGNIGGNAPGSQPVEISAGQFDGSRLSFEVWALDDFRNRTRYEGQLENNTLRLTLTREVSTGIETIAEVAATRLAY